MAQVFDRLQIVLYVKYGINLHVVIFVIFSSTMAGPLKHRDSDAAERGSHVYFDLNDRSWRDDFSSLSWLLHFVEESEGE